MNFVKQTKVLCVNGKCKQMTTMNVSNPVPQKSHCNLVYSKFLDKLKKTPKRKTTKRKTIKRKIPKRKTLKHKKPKRKTPKRKTPKRKLSKRK